VRPPCWHACKAGGQSPSAASHPTFPPEPSLRDIENQSQSQAMFKGQPYVGIINGTSGGWALLQTAQSFVIAPYYHSTTSSARAVADVKCFWINTDKIVHFAAEGDLPSCRWSMCSLTRAQTLERPSRFRSSWRMPLPLLQMCCTSWYAGLYLEGMLKP
jgi:hypothetical protein